MSNPLRTSSGGEGSLRPEAQEFQPQAPRKESNVKPIRTQGRRGDVLATLDAIPFTPSQGVCTPSPPNMAAMWVPHPFFHQHHQAWGSMANYVGSPGLSSGSSDGSILHSSASQPGTPGGGAAMFPTGASMVWGGFCQPLPYSPTALQIAAASGALGSDPGTPVRGGRRSSGGGGGGASGAGGPFMAVMPGSPMVVSPGQIMFAQYFGDMGGSSKSHSPPESKASSGSGDEGEGSDVMSSAGSGSMEVSDAAHLIAKAMCAAQQLPGDPPQQLLELASLLHAYGLVSAVSAFPPTPAGPAPLLSPDSRRQAVRMRQKTAPKLNSDGSVRLNARQRRTLRRAQERAMKALLEAQTKAHGISVEQAASNLASIGVASMLLGSPPPMPLPVHSSLQMTGLPYLAAPAMALSPGMMAPHEYSLVHGMVPPAVMAQHHGGGAGYEAAAGYGMAVGTSGEAGMPLPMPMHGLPHGTPLPCYAGSPAGSGGYSPSGAQRSGGYRGTPGGGRMSRFAPTDTMTAF